MFERRSAGTTSTPVPVGRGTPEGAPLQVQVGVGWQGSVVLERGRPMRRYDDPVDVRKGWVTGVEGPEQFLWRGRLWKVRAVLAHWVETAPWWQSSGVRAVIGSDEPAAPGAPLEARGTDLLVERELWRVEAGRGADAGAEGGGVFDLSFDWSDGCWQLVGCED